MLSKKMLKMVSALNSKDIKELRYLFSHKSMTIMGHDIANLFSSYDTEQLKTMLTPDELQVLLTDWGIAEYAFGHFEQVLGALRDLIEMLRMKGSGMDRLFYHKALLKLNELQDAWDSVDDD